MRRGPPLELLSRPPEDRERQPLADLPEHLPRLERARRRWRTVLLHLDAALQRRRVGSRHDLHATKVEVVQQDGRTQFVPGIRSGYRTESRPVRSPGFGSRDRGMLKVGRQASPTRQCVARRSLDDECAWRLHRRRHAARSVAHRWRLIAEGRCGAHAVDEYLMDADAARAGPLTPPAPSAS